jgi:GeoRSP system SPASM domain protein
MNLKELSSPIRVYWDIGPPGNDVLPDYRKIAGEIPANKVLSLQLTESGPFLSQECLAILDELKDKMVSLSVVALPSALDAKALGALRRLPVKTVLVSVASVDELASLPEISRQAEGKPAVGVSYSVTRTNYIELPEALKFCLDHKIANLVLPMQRLTESAECFSFSFEERRELAARLGKTIKPDWLKITIHDPFLWRAFFPAIEFPDGGCQAANTMLYISPRADVYPCPSLPIKIGDLMKTSLKDVVNSGLKKELRKSLLASPADCRGCGDTDQCKGGCRGRAYVAAGSLDRSDPACGQG